MRNTMKTMIMFLFILSVALNAQAAKYIGKIESMSCGLQGLGLAVSHTVTFKSALEKASKQCWAVGNSDAANKYAARARNCGNADIDKCANHFKALKQTWCGFNADVQLQPGQLSPMDFQKRHTALTEAQINCSDENKYTKGEQTAAYNYFNKKSTVNGVQTWPAAACSLNAQHVDSLCLDTYNALFQPNSPY